MKPRPWCQRQSNYVCLAFQVAIQFIIIIMNMYCVVCLLTVPELKKIEFGLVGIQTVADLIGAVFYVIYVCQLYLQRFFFYCTLDYAQPHSMFGLKRVDNFTNENQDVFEQVGLLTEFQEYPENSHGPLSSI